MAEAACLKAARWISLTAYPSPTTMSHSARRLIGAIVLEQNERLGLLAVAPNDAGNAQGSMLHPKYSM